MLAANIHAARRSAPVSVSFVAVLGLIYAVSHAALPAAAPKLPPGETVTVGGKKLWYISEGRGEPLVLISGGPGAAHYLYPYFSALAETHRIIYLDSFGTGNSERAANPSGYTFQRHVDEIEGLRHALNLGRINLLGHSYGSMVAQAFALKYPTSLHRLLLACPFDGARMWQIGNEHVALLLRVHYPELWTRIEAARAKGLHQTDKELADLVDEIPEALLYYANVANAGRLTVVFNPDVPLGLSGPDPDFQVSGQLAALNFRAELNRVKVPSLVLAARHDRVALPRDTLLYKTYLPQATFVMFEQSGHNFFLEENDRMLVVIREFMSQRVRP